LRTSASGELRLLENTKETKKDQLDHQLHRQQEEHVGSPNTVESAGKEDPDCGHWWKKRVTGFLGSLSTFKMVGIATEGLRIFELSRMLL
jgi:hypothetical protein